MFLDEKVISCLKQRDEPLNTSELVSLVFDVGKDATIDREARAKLVNRLSQRLLALRKKKKGVVCLPVKGWGNVHCLPEWCNGGVLRKDYLRKLNNKRIDISVALVDDQVLFRKGLAELLHSFGGFHVCIEADNKEMLLEKLRRAAAVPDICIISSNALMLHNNEIVKEIRSHFIQMRILVLAASYNEYSIVKMLSDGIRGYLLKNTSPDELVEALFMVYEQGHYRENISEELLESARNHIRNYTVITERQIHFMSLCMTNMTYEEMAREMGVVPKTVDGYRDTLFKRYNIKNRAELVVFALKNGLIEL
jgi:two-component system invasion response regulator UvrY